MRYGRDGLGIIRRGLFGILVVPLAVSGRAQAASPPSRIHVRGSARIDAHAARAAGKLVLRGTLTDDAGEPIANDRVTVVLSPASAPNEPLSAFSESGSAAPEACSLAEPGPAARNPLSFEPQVGASRAGSTHQAIVPTDEAGRFCMQAGVPIDRYVAHVEWKGSTLIDGGKVDAPIDLALRSVELGFSPEPTAVTLDDGSLSLEAVATLDDEGTTTSGAALLLRVVDERGTELATGTTNGSGHTRLSVDRARLGPPGRGELRLTFDGSADIGKSVHVTPIERRTHVTLDAAQPASGLLAGSPDDGLAFAVLARTRGGQPVPTGSIQAILGTTVVGAAPVEKGQARIIATFVAPETPSVTLHLRYVADAPWYLADPDLAVTLPIHGPSPWQKIPLIVAGLGVALWLVLGRAARARVPHVPAPPREPVSHGEAKIDVVRSVKSSRAGWAGRVIDAHDGSPIASAKVTVQRGTFEEVTEVATTTASEAGRFELRALDALPGDLLVIEAPLHAALRRPLPPFGELEIALVLRRRALLDRLVHWARARGRPYDARPEPTPGHVRRAATHDFAAARWADAVERAAFGPEEVDGKIEGEVDRLAPATLSDAAKTIKDPEPSGNPRSR